MPAETLTLEHIVRGAIDLLDAEGLEGLNMRALGKRLGSAATAVYWHVTSKRELVTLAGDQVFGEITLPDLATTDWRAAATSMATDFRAMLTRHPWLVQVFGSYVVYGPARARHDDRTLAVYEAGGFASAEAERASATVLTFVLGSALGPAGAAAFKRQVVRAGADSETLIRQSLATRKRIMQQFPRLRARLEEASRRQQAGRDDAFNFGLQAVLDGLEARIKSGRHLAQNRGETERPRSRRSGRRGQNYLLGSKRRARSARSQA